MPGYFKDPLTAHGITDALRDAELLARAVLAGTDGALAATSRRATSLSMRAVLDHRRDRVVRLGACRACRRCTRR
jgi:flavin-dependent dehydrogenase